MSPEERKGALVGLLGRLRINAPLTFGNLHLAPLWGEFLKLHPAVELDITLTDRPAWVVTFHNVGIMLHGPAKGEPVQADVYVIVDAETGAWLETVSAPAQT